MPTYDYECRGCGHRMDDLYFSVSERPPVIRCPACRGECRQVFDAPRNIIHSSVSSMYGRWHPGFGCVVEDRGHKRALMKRYGVMEAADPVGGSRCHIPAGYGQEPKPREPKVEWISPDDHRAKTAGG